MEPKFCPKCGTPIPEGQSFCPNCATVVSNPAEQPTQNTVKKPSIDIKATVLANIIPLVIAALGLIIYFYGTSVSIPSSTFSFSSIKEYVGGDAYNAIIEASIRGGRIAGAKTEAALFQCTGLLMTAISLLKLNIKKN